MVECKHTVTISAIQAHDLPRAAVEQMRVGQTWDCPHCADAPPPEPTVRERRMAFDYDSLAD